MTGAGSRADRLADAVDSRPGRLVAAVLLAVAGLGTGTVVVRGAAFALDRAGVEVTTALAILLSAVLLQGVALGGVSLIYLRARGLSLDWFGVAVPDFRGVLWTVSGYLLALAGAYVLALAVTLSGLSPARNRIGEIAGGNPEVFLLLIPVSFLLIGPGEELLFRGVVQGTLRERFSAPVAVGVATLVFAAAHYSSLSGAFGSRVLTVALLFVPGLVLGVAYEATDNLVVPALIHGAYNATLFALAYASTVFGAGAGAGG